MNKITTQVSYYFIKPPRNVEKSYFRDSESNLHYSECNNLELQNKINIK